MMTRQRQPPARRYSVVAIALGLVLPVGLAAAGPAVFAGQRLEDALRVLEARGLRLVFSSGLVTSDLRVKSEPRTKPPREQLAEILEPHGLTAEDGPGGVIQIVRQKRPARERARVPAAQSPPKDSYAYRHDKNSSDTVYRERVTVTANTDGAGGIFASAHRSLGSDDLRAFGGYIADDPLRVVQALPGVAGGDDFRSDYSVRASSFRHAGVVVDGVVAPWLQHAALGRGDTGTLTMIPSDMVQDATLLVGAYPRRDGGQLGPQLNLTLREGSRTAPRFGLGVSGTMSTLAAEGPLGRSARGSWLVAVRQSHAEWPVGRSDHDSTVFGFGDVQSKLVYDLRPGQEVSLSLVAGVSNVERDDPNPLTLRDGLNRAGMAVMAWRSVIGSRTVVTQRISSLSHAFLNRDEAARLATRGTNGAYGYRVDMARNLAGGVLEAGAQARQLRGTRHGQTITFDTNKSWLERSGYASYRRSVASGVTLAAGVRVADSTLVHRQAIDRWLQAEWSAGPRWLVHGSTGVTHQFPSLENVSGWTGAMQLRPERATHAEFGIGRRLFGSARWDATLFARRERDALREPDVHPWLVDGVLLGDDDDKVAARFENALRGTARGLELKVERRSEAGFSGWVGYSYGIARYTDSARGETFPADCDQRHAINMSGTAALPWRTRLSLSFRSGTNFPVPGYLVNRDGSLFAGEHRNQVRLPAYARLDLRARRTFDRAGRRFIVFAEVMNVLNRANLGLTDGLIRRETAQALGFTERLFPRLLTAGIRFEF